MNELKNYKKTLINKIISSERLVKLIAEDDAVNPESLVYSHVFPYPHIVDTTTLEGTYITMKISVPKVYNKTYKDLNIWIYIITHERLLNTSGGLRTDLIASEIENLLNGSLDFGLGRLELVSAEDFAPANNYQGIVMKYIASDFNR